jgi:hypothetical protein
MMTLEVFLYAIAALAIPIGGWMITMMWLMKEIKKSTDLTFAKVVRLEEMHNNPDKYGFGVGLMDTKLEGIHSALKTLVHYVRWQAEQASGKEPPPPPPIV